MADLGARVRTVAGKASAPRSLSRVARAVRKEGLTYLTPSKLARIEACVKDVRARGIPGDLLETGVALGGSAIVIARLLSGDRCFHGYDVFGMIPPPSESDPPRCTTGTP